MKIKAYYEPMTKNIIDEKALSELEKLKVKCVCGHTKIMPVYQDYAICNFCKRKMYNNTKMYFMYKLRKEINKNEK
jgi:hypothetical protein